MKTETKMIDPFAEQLRNGAPIIELEAGRWYHMHVYGGRVLVAVLQRTGGAIRAGFASDALACPQWNAIDEDGVQHTLSALDLNRKGIGALTGPVEKPEITPQEVSELNAKRERTLAEERQARDNKADEDAKARAGLPGRFPHLVPLDKTPKKSKHAAGAANLRKMLAAKFPGVMFRVTSDSYSGGSSINAHWQDGPIIEDVKPLLESFSTRSFDGMQDLETIRDNNFADVFGGAGYVFGERRMSECTRATLEEWARERFEAQETWDSPCFENLAYRLFTQQTIPAGAVVTGVKRREGDTPAVITGVASGWIIIYTTPKPPEPRPIAEGVTVATLTENIEKGGLELRFPAKPEASTLAALKAAGWRWSRFSGCWWIKASKEARQFAQNITG